LTNSSELACRVSFLLSPTHLPINHHPRHQNSKPRASCQLAAYGPDADTQRRATTAGGAAPGPQSAGGAPAGASGASWVLLKRHEVDTGLNASMEISREGRLLAMGQSEGNLLVGGERGGGWGWGAGQTLCCVLRIQPTYIPSVP
jgi:hypothetical protein